MKTKKAVSKRFKITKKGKLLRMAMGQGHCLAKKRTHQIKRRKQYRGLDEAKKIIGKYF